MELLREAEEDPALDVAVSHALLERAAREKVACVRLWRPRRPALSLGRLDLREPAAQRVARLAERSGVTPVRRLAGGRAAVLDDGCLCIGWAEPEPRLEESGERYRRAAEVVEEALAALGVAAVREELEGEWCPGAWSVRGASGKLAGLAQRVITGAAWCEALIVVRRSGAHRPLAQEVHRLLGIPWRAAAQGTLAEELPLRGDLHGDLTAELLHVLTRREGELLERPLPEDVLARARELAPEHAA